MGTRVATRRRATRQPCSPRHDGLPLHAVGAIARVGDTGAHARGAADGDEESVAALPPRIPLGIARDDGELIGSAHSNPIVVIETVHLALGGVHVPKLLLLYWRWLFLDRLRLRHDLLDEGHAALLALRCHGEIVAPLPLPRAACVASRDQASSKADLRGFFDDFARAER